MSVAVAGSAPTSDNSGAEPSQTTGTDSIVTPSWRGRTWLICVALTALAFIQEPGRIAADTKLDLNINPGGLMSRALHLWDSSGFSGQLQNQGYGYLWPMGPFYWLGQAIGLPAWVVQRLWWSLLLCLAFVGMVKLAKALNLGTPGSQLVGALTFALAPRIVSNLGAASIESWPTALAPWVLLPLVIATQPGTSRRRWAAASAIAFACIGGVNAVATASVLVLAVWWLATRERNRATATLAGWWALGILLASLWWAIPLLILGRYSPPFLDWIESASITTSITSTANVLRGVDTWLPYLADSQGPLLPSGWALVQSWPGILGTAIVATIGAAGLTMRKLPERPFLVGAALIGLALVSLGHVGAADGFGADAVRTWLDGPLAPLRNVHKFDVILRLPLALGCTVVVAAVMRWAHSRSLRSVPLAPVVGIALASAITLSAWPMLAGTVARDRSFIEIPEYWRDTATYLSEQDAGRALILPEASAAVFQWGRTNDEPLQALDMVPWTVRDSVPLSSAGNIRMLDSIKEQVESGRGSPGLAGLLQRAGITHIVVRNDIDPSRTGAPPRSVIHSTLDNSPGLARVKVFGPLLQSYVTETAIADDGLDGAFPAVEVYIVRGDTPTGVPLLRDASDPIRIVGGAEAVLGLESVTGTDATVLTTGSPGEEALPAGPVIATDSLRRREVAFGAVRNNLSQTMTESDPFSLNRPVRDYLPEGTTNLTTAEFVGGVTFSASSSGSDPGALTNRSPANQPWAAVDGDGGTSWVTGEIGPGVGSWWQINFAAPEDMPSEIQASVTAGRDGGARPTRVKVSTDQGSVVTDIDPNELIVDVQVLPGPTQFLRVTMDGAEPDRQDNGFGIAELKFPMGAIERAIQTLDGKADGWLLQATPGNRASCVNNGERITCSNLISRSGEEDLGIDRLINVPQESVVRVLASAVVREESSDNRLFSPSAVNATVTASSTATMAPGNRGAAALDDDVTTAWIADPTDRDPYLNISLPESRTITGLSFSNRIDLNASSPLEVTVSTPTQTIEGFVDNSGRIDFPPLTTDTLRLDFGVRYPKTSITEGGRERTTLPIGVSDLTIIGAEDISAALPLELPVGMACGFAPSLRVDDVLAAETKAEGIGRDALAGQPLTVSQCDAPTVTIPAGPHRVQMLQTAELSPLSLALLTPELEALLTSAPSPVAASLTDQSPTRRIIEITPASGVRTLELTENFSSGWHAKLQTAENEVNLTPVEVDGWRQAWVVPSDVAGEVVVSFEPDRWYRAGLIVGLIALLTLLPMVLLPGRTSPVPIRPSARPIWAIAAIAVAVVSVVAGWWGLVGLALASGAMFMGRRPWLVVVLATSIVYVLQILHPWPASNSQPDWVTVAQTIGVCCVVAAWSWRSLDATMRALAARRQSN